MNIAIPSFVIKLMDRLAENGFESFVVGGAVRSVLLSLPVHDYDLTTNALPEEMKQVFQDCHTIETGIRHGTLTVFSDHKPVEITTYRRDSAYSDHRHPDRVEYTSALKEDCARRDFTVNALCADREGRLYDFFQGREDLEKHLIRCIGSPDERFNEDALRILRALRFAARLSFAIDPDTSEALLRNRELLRYISMERIHDETMGFLQASGCADLFEKNFAVFEVFLPELKDLDNEGREALFASLRRSEDDAMIRFALILSCLSDPMKIMKHMKFSNHDMKTVLNLLALKEKPLDTPADIRRILRDLASPFEMYTGFRCALDPAAEREAMMSKYEQILSDHDCCTLKELAVNGSDLIQAGLKGKEIADALDLLLNEVIEKRLPNEKEILMNHITGKH